VASVVRWSRTYGDEKLAPYSFPSMSRIGKKPIAIPDGVTVEIKPGLVSVKGPKGELSQAVSTEMTVSRAEAPAEGQTEEGETSAGVLTVERPTDRGEHRALHGLTRSLIANMVEGVTQGFERRLEIQGVGYRARLQGKALELSVGYSHTITVTAPEGIEFELPTPTQIIVRGIDKQLVGEIAARVRRTRPPEPYRGKGVRYQGEYVRRKVGKRA
jgi:large subunit ribosomal protein L6